MIMLIGLIFGDTCNKRILISILKASFRLRRYPDPRHHGRSKCTQVMAPNRDNSNLCYSPATTLLQLVLANNKPYIPSGGGKIDSTMFSSLICSKMVSKSSSTDALSKPNQPS